MYRPSAIPCSVVAVLLLGSGCSHVQTIDRSAVETVTLRELSANPGEYQDLLRAYADGSGGLILEIEEGDELPLELAIRHPLVSVDTGKNTVLFQRHMFIYLSARGLLISPDGERWAPIQEMDAWKELFGGFKEGRHGTLSVGLGVTAEDGAAVTVVVADE
jgi:hypothetical protein